MVLEESSTFVACLHKQIPFGSFLDDVRKQLPITPWVWAYIRGPIYVVDRFHRFIHSLSSDPVHQNARVMLFCRHASMEGVYAVCVPLL